MISASPRARGPPARTPVVAKPPPTLPGGALIVLNAFSQPSRAAVSGRLIVRHARATWALLTLPGSRLVISTTSPQNNAPAMRKRQGMNSGNSTADALQRCWCRTIVWWTISSSALPRNRKNSWFGLGEAKV